MGAQAGTPPTGQVVNKFEMALGQVLLQAKLLTPAQLSQAMWEKTENNLYLTEICLENGWIPENELYTHVPTDQLRLEEILMLYGYLSVEQLQKLVRSQQSQPHQSLEEILVSQGWVESEVLDWVLTEQQALWELAQANAWQTIQHRLVEFHAAESETETAAAQEVISLSDPSAEDSDDDLGPFSFNPLHLDEEPDQDTRDPLVFHDPDSEIDPVIPPPPPEPAFLEDPRVTQELEQLRVQVVALQEQLQAQSQQHQEVLEEITQQSQHRIDQLEQALQTIESDRDQLQHQVTQQEQQQEQQAQDHLALQEQFQDLQAQQEREQAESQAALQQLQAQKTQVEEQLQITRQAAKKLHSQFQQRAQEQAQAQSQLQELKQQLQQQQEHQNQLQAQLDQIPQLQNQIAELTQRLSQAQSDLEQRTAQQDQDQHQIQRLQQQLETQRQTQEQVQAKGQKALELFEEQIRSLTQQLHNTEESYHTSGALLKQEQTRAERLSEEKDQAIEQQLEAQRRAHQAEQASQAQRYQIQTQAEQITLLQAQLQGEHQQAQAYGTQLQQQQEQIAQLQEEQQQAQEHRAQLQQQQEQITQLQAQLQQEQEEAQTQQTLLHHQQERIAQLQDQLQEQEEAQAQYAQRQQQQESAAQAEQVATLTIQLQEVRDQSTAQAQQIEALQQQLQQEQEKAPAAKNRPLKRPQPMAHSSITEQIAEAWGIEEETNPSTASQTKPEELADLESPPIPPEPAEDLDLFHELDTMVLEEGELPEPEDPAAVEDGGDDDLDAFEAELADLEVALELDDPILETSDVTPQPPPKPKKLDAFAELLDGWDKELEDLAAMPQEPEPEEDSPALAAATPWVRRVMKALQEAALISRADVDLILAEWEQTGGTFTNVLSRCSGLKPETVKFFSEGGYSVGLMRSRQIGDYLQASGLVSPQEIEVAQTQVEPDRPLIQVLVDQGILHAKTADYFVKNFSTPRRSRPTVEERFG